jgi:hypothetical protein
MKKFNKRIQEFKKILLSIKGGDFPQWHESLSPIEKLMYTIGFKELQSNNEKYR